MNKNAIDNWINKLSCPHCNLILERASLKCYQCPNNHSFDISKEGYLNLLAVNKKKSKTPGDNDLMIQARRLFLEKAYYYPLVENIAELVRKYLDRDCLYVLDAGCGEGYYLDKITQLCTTSVVQSIGIDISRNAIKKATKKYPTSFYSVSSVYDLPLLDHSIDMILSIFAPIHPDEFDRVLSDRGMVFVVVAGEDHLNELAKYIYKEFKPHKSKVTGKMQTHFKCLSKQELKYTTHLNTNPDILNLLKMTPYYWNTSKESMAQIESLDSLAITCHFEILLFACKE